jgi:hypothetical protein
VSVDPKKHVFTGLVRPREHCTFTWEQPEGDPRRTAIVRENHCAQCVDALRERGYLLRSDAEAESR